MKQALVWAALLVSVRVCLAASQAVPSLSPQAPPTPPAQSPAAAAPLRATYILGPDDVLLVNVLDVPEMSGKNVRVDPNGDLPLPLVGRIHVSGMTVEELEVEIVSRLRTYLNEPDVALSVVEFHSQAVSVIGAVRNPGLQPLQGKRTLLEVLSLAGGVGTDAGPIVRVVRRPEWNQFRIPGGSVDPITGASLVEIPLKELLDASSPASNVTVMPNDVVSVPRADVVYVVGEVGRAGSVPLSRGDEVSVMEAVSVAGGVLRTAAPKKARILRFNAATQTRNEVAIDIQRVMQGKGRDVMLRAGDILVVPDNTGRRITARAAEALVQMGIMIGSFSAVR